MSAISEVFYKAQFSKSVTESLGGATITRITVDQSSRIMHIYLSIPDEVAEEPLLTFKQELRYHFIDLADVQIKVDGKVIPSYNPPSLPGSAPPLMVGQGNGQRRFRKVKVNKTIP